MAAGEMILAALARSSAIDLTAARYGPADRERPSRRRERAWVRAAQAGSDEAMEALFRVHWRPAHRAAYLIVHDAAAAEDIAQEAFLAAIRALDRFDRRRPFGPWLHRIVVNRAIDWSRARALRREVAESFESEAPPERPDGWSDAIVDALAVLDPDQRAAVVLRHLLEYTPGEIAQLLELPRGTVNSRLRRALDRLAVELGEERS
jgi:RNA polymerase sigma-70 factor, ECF subfamily